MNRLLGFYAAGILAMVAGLLFGSNTAFAGGDELGEWRDDSYLNLNRQSDGSGPAVCDEGVSRTETTCSECKVRQINPVTQMATIKVKEKKTTWVRQCREVTVTDIPTSEAVERTRQTLPSGDCYGPDCEPLIAGDEEPQQVPVDNQLRVGRPQTDDYSNCKLVPVVTYDERDEVVPARTLEQYMTRYKNCVTRVVKTRNCQQVVKVQKQDIYPKKCRNCQGECDYRDCSYANYAPADYHSYPGCPAKSKCGGYYYR